MTQEEIKRDIQDGINSWDKTMNFGIPSFSLFYYTPNSYRNEDRNSDMNSIWDIKNGKMPIFGSKKVAKVLKHFFLSDTLSSLTFLCIPASKKWIYAKRYEEFSNLVTSDCNMLNAYNHITLKYDANTKFDDLEDIDNLDFDSKWFDGKTIILFEGLLNKDKGAIIRSMIDKLEEMGSTVIGVISMGLAIKNPFIKSPFRKMEMGVKTKWVPEPKRPQITEPSVKSMRLFEIVNSVEKVASLRRLSIQTIYSHLFTTGKIDPYSLISEEEYNKAVEFIKGKEQEFELSSNKQIDFLNVDEEMAFSYLWKRYSAEGNKYYDEEFTKNPYRAAKRIVLMVTQEEIQNEINEMSKSFQEEIKFSNRFTYAPIDNLVRIIGQKLNYKDFQEAFRIIYDKEPEYSGDYLFYLQKLRERYE